MENEVCPLLGLVEDQGAYLTYPSYENRCYSSVVPQPVPLNEQTFFCLGGHKERCPRFQSRQALLKAQGVADDDVAEQAAAAPGASEAGEPAGDDVLAWDAPEDGDGEGDSFAWTSQPEEPGWSSEGYGLEPPQAPPLLPMTASGRARRPVWPLLLAAGTLVAVLMLCGLASAGWLGWRALSTQLAVQPTGTPVVEVGGGPPGSAATPTSGPGGVVIVVATPTPNPPEATATAEAAATATMLALATATPTATEFISFDTPIPQFPTATPTWTPFVVPTPRDTPTFFPTNTPFVPQATATWTWTPAPAQATATPSVEPFFASFVANPLNIQYGQTSTLTWTVRGVRAIYLDGEAVSGPTGSKSVQPLRTTTYVLRMIMPDNSVREETQTVTVTAPTPSATPSPTATPTATPFVNMTFAQDLSLTSINGQESSCRTGSGCTLFQVQVRNVGNRPAEYQLTKTETIPIGWGVFFCWGGDCEFGNTPPPRTLAAGARDTVSINFRVPSALEDGQTAVVNVNGSCPACAIPPFQPYSNTFTVRVILPTPTPPPTGTATHTPTVTPTPTWTATPTWTPTTPPGN